MIQSAGAVLQKTTSRDAEQSPGGALGVNWQPRSASVLGSQRTLAPPSNQQDPTEDFDDRSSWVDFDDSPSEASNDPGSTRQSQYSVTSRNQNRESIASFESQPDIDSVLETLNGPSESRSGYKRDSRYSYDKSMYHADADEDDDDPRDYYTSNSAFASDAEDVPADSALHDRTRLTALPADSRSRARHSTSPSPTPSELEDELDSIADRKSRVSILDGKRSGKVRDKLVRRVEQMRREGEQSALR